MRSVAIDAAVARSRARAAGGDVNAAAANAAAANAATANARARSRSGGSGGGGGGVGGAIAVGNATDRRAVDYLTRDAANPVPTPVVLSKLGRIPWRGNFHAFGAPLELVHAYLLSKGGKH